MIDYHSTLVSALKTVGIPVHYELVLHSGLPTPCISYQEANNAAEETGDTLGYSSLAYTIKVWHTDLETIQRYAVAIDAVLRPLGWSRTNATELSNGTMIQKIMTYEATALEIF